MKIALSKTRISNPGERVTTTEDEHSTTVSSFAIGSPRIGVRGLRRPKDASPNEWFSITQTVRHVQPLALKVHAALPGTASSSSSTISISTAW